MRLAIQTATTTANSTMSPFTTHLPYGVTVREQPMPVNLPVVQCPNLLPCSLASENRAPEWARQEQVPVFGRNHHRRSVAEYCGPIRRCATQLLRNSRVNSL
jgi:hypothetical protein